MGVKEFQHKLGLPLQLYAPYFCADSPYATKYNFLHSDTKLPGCGGSPSFNFTTPSPARSLEFFTWFMKLGMSYGETAGRSVCNSGRLLEAGNCRGRWVRWAKEHESGTGWKQGWRWKGIGTRNQGRVFR